MKVDIQKARKLALEEVSRKKASLYAYNWCKPNAQSKSALYADYLDVKQAADRYRHGSGGPRAELPGYLAVPYAVKDSIEAQLKRVQRSIPDPSMRREIFQKARRRFSISVPILGLLAVLGNSQVLTVASLPLPVSGALLLTSTVASITVSVSAALSMLQMFKFSRRAARGLEKQAEGLRFGSSLASSEIQMSLDTFEQARRNWLDVGDGCAVSYLRMLEVEQVEGTPSGAQARNAAFGPIPKPGDPARLPYARLILEVDAVRYRDKVPAAVRYPANSRAVQLSSALDRARGPQPQSTRLQADGFDFSR